VGKHVIIYIRLFENFLLKGFFISDFIPSVN